MYGQQKIKHSE